MLKEVKRLHALGYAVHLLHPRSKKPIENKWTSGKRKTLEELKNNYKHGMNIGVRLGKASEIGNGYLAVIDCDMKTKEPEHRKEFEATLASIFPDLEAGAPVVASGRGGGSRHIYVVTPEPVKPQRLAQSKKMVKVLMPSVKPSKTDSERLSTKEIEAGLRMRAAWEISLMGEGQQVVLPPSVHPDSGKNYVWVKRVNEASDLPCLDWENKETNEEDSTTVEDFEVEEVCLDLERVSDRIKAMIRTGEGCEDRSAGLFSAALALCGAGLSDNQILSILSDRDNYLGSVAHEHTQSKSRSRAVEWLRKYTLRRARRETDAARDFDDLIVVEKLGAEEAAKQKEEIEEEIGSAATWRSLIERSGKDGDGPPKPTLQNLVIILEHAVNGKPFWQNLFSTRTLYGCVTPWGGKPGTALADEDLVKIKMWVAQNFRFEPHQNLIVEAVTFLANKNARHPVREYLKGLKWDGKKRIDFWLRDYLGVVVAEERKKYFRAISRKYLMGMVARVMEPGCQTDSFLVLEGVQGVGKSSTGRILASADWYCDTLPDIKDKDAMLNLQGAWIVEISELAALRGAQSKESYKAFLSRRVDRFRSPFGRITNDVPRQSMFLGTTNDEDYLNDKGGNRRFWPARVHRCDFDRLAEDRDQLFAEAFHRWKEKPEKLCLEGEAKLQGEAEQLDRVADDESDHMEQLLVDWLKRPEEWKFDLARFRLSDLFADFGPFVNQYQVKNYHLQLAGRALKRLGGKRRMVRGTPVWGLSTTPTPTPKRDKSNAEMW